jgi:hypothetical protein
MFIEKKRKGVSIRLFTANGDTSGLVTVSDASDFFVKQRVVIESNTKPAQEFEIKRFVSNNSFRVGPIGASISTYANLSQYLVADNARISAPEQDRPGIKPDEIKRAVYAEEPIVANRVIAVDEYGNYYNTQNPLPVRLSDGSVNIGSVNAELEVQLSHLDNYPDIGDVADSVRIGDGVNEAKITKAKVGTNTGLNTNSINDLFSKPFTRLEVLTKNDDGDPLTIRSSYNGTPVQLMTIVYDSDGDFQSADVVDL